MYKVMSTLDDTVLSENKLQVAENNVNTLLNYLQPKITSYDPVPSNSNIRLCFHCRTDYRRKLLVLVK